VLLNHVQLPPSIAAPAVYVICRPVCRPRPARKRKQLGTAYVAGVPAGLSEHSRQAAERPSDCRSRRYRLDQPAVRMVLWSLAQW